MKKPKPHFILRLFRFVALLWLLFAGYTGMQAFSFFDNALPSDGVVLSVEVTYGDDSTIYRPTIGFKDIEGTSRTAPTLLASSVYDYQQGDRVEILYDSYDPQKIHLNTWWAVWGSTVSMFFTAIILLSVTSAMTSMSVAKRHKAQTATPEPTQKYVHLVPDKKDEGKRHSPTVRRM